MLREQFAMALDSLRANKVRSLLTMLGIIIGTGTLVAVLSLGNAVQGSVFEQFIDLGTRRIAITKGDPSARGARDVPGYGLLSISDAHVIEELAAQRADLFRTSTVEVIVPLDIRAGAVGLRDTVVGTGEQYTAIQSVQLAHGRFLTAADEARRAPVVVLGGLIARDLYGTDEARQAAAIGSTVEINGRPLEVIGILRAAGGPFSADRRALVPISTLRLRLVSNLDIPGRGMRVDTVLIGLQSEQQTEQASEAIRAALRNARGVPAEAIDDFELSLPTEALNVLAGINGAITGFVAFVAAISLLVGGIGIMNIMLVAVTERTREIGVRKALGATDQDILGQFVLEATAVSLIGGTIGVSGAIALVLLVSTLSGIAAPIAWGAVVLALVFAACVGIGFGSYPARRAALLLPIEALRYE